MNYNESKRDIYIPMVGILLFSFVALGLSLTLDARAVFLLGALLACMPFVVYKGMIPALIGMGIVLVLYVAMMLMLGHIHWGLVLYYVAYAPIVALLLKNMNKALLGIEMEYAHFKKQLEETSTIDTITQLKNLRAYQNDAQIYMKIAKRYQLTLVLMTIRLYNGEACLHTLGEQNFVSVLKKISQCLRSTIRLEDISYSIDESNIMWAVLMFTKKEGIEIALERIRETLADIDTEAIVGIKIALHFDYTYAIYAGDVDQSANALLQEAIEKLPPHDAEV